MSAPQSIVVVGGGTAGWMAVNLFMHAWPSTKVTLVESSDIGIIGVGEGATPYLKTFFARLGISESEWMPACDASYKVGISFENWSGRADYAEYFHPFFSALDKPSANMFFHNCGVRRRGGDAYTRPNDFFITGVLAQQKKSPLLTSNQGEIDYAYHFDSGKLGQFLKEKALAKGLTHIVDNVIDISCDTQVGISAVGTQKHGQLTAELYIDCTGFSAKLIHQTLKQEYVSYADNLLNNAAVAIQTPNQANAALPVQTRSVALTNGWMWHIPLASRQGNGYVYSNQHISANEAECELRSALGVSEQADIKVKHLNMRIGRLQQHWHKNCLAVGLAQGFIEPLEATALMLTQLTIDQFIDAYSQPQQANQYKVFNQHINTVFDGVRDYIVAHYQLSQRSDSQYWRDNQHNTHVPQVLSEIREAWLSGTDVEQVLTQHTRQLVYLRPSWYCILAGMGVFPRVNTSQAQQNTNAVPLHQVRQYTDQVIQQHFS
ncbi:MAG: tryptophan halogenase family protein [Glaciecola sp.]